MSIIDNNQLEVYPSARRKRKMSVPLPNTYANPALDLLADEDRMDNATMEVQPGKKRKYTKSCGEAASFDNTALDLGMNRPPVSQILMHELENVKRNVKVNPESTERTKESTSFIQKPLSPLKEKTLIVVTPNIPSVETDTPMLETENVESEIYTPTENPGVHVIEINEPIYANVMPDDGTSLSLKNVIEPEVIPHPNNQNNLSLSFIDRLGIDSTNLSNHSLFLDDDLNESNIMEIKTITDINKKKGRKPRKNTNPFLNDSGESSDMTVIPSENPFLNLIEHTDVVKNTGNIAESDQICKSQELVIEKSPHNIPFMDSNMESIHIEDETGSPADYTQVPVADIRPRRLFTNDTNSTVSTVNDLSINYTESQPEYVNVLYRPESPVYSNIEEVYEANMNYNKQSKILGCDVSSFNSRDILNLNSRPGRFGAGLTHSISSNDSECKNSDFTQKVNKLSKKVIKKLKKTFNPEKHDQNMTLNPYEVSRKPSKVKTVIKEAGFENPALNLNNSDELEEIYDDDHVYETVRTARNTQLNMNVTPLKECNRDLFDQTSHINTSGKKQVRFDSTLNQEKVITGNSFEGDIISPGLDNKIDNFHDELENCINERKFIAQNM